jgi:hypothetical protein
MRLGIGHGTSVYYSDAGGGDFAPSGLSGLQLWLDGADEATKTLNGANVSAWADKSGNGRNATQATPANQPTNVSGGAPSAGVSGVAATNKFMTLTSLSLGTAATIAVVCTAQVTAAGYVWSNGVGSNGLLSNHVATGDLEWYNTPDRQKYADDPVTNNRYRTVTTQANGVSLVGRSNGAQVFSVVPAVALSSIATIGAATTGPASPYRGVIHEIIIYNRVLSAGEITQLETYLARWA